MKKLVILWLAVLVIVPGTVGGILGGCLGLNPPMNVVWPFIFGLLFGVAWTAFMMPKILEGGS